MLGAALGRVGGITGLSRSPWSRREVAVDRCEDSGVRNSKMGTEEYMPPSGKKYSMVKTFFKSLLMIIDIVYLQFC